LVASALCVLLGCESHAPRPVSTRPAPLPSAKKKPKPEPQKEPTREPPPVEAAARPDDAQAAEARGKPRPPKPPTTNETNDAPVENSRYVLDGLNDIGPAAPAAAFAHGVVLIRRDDELVISRLIAPPSKSKKPAAGAFEELHQSPQDFYPVARGPAVSSTHAYWVSKGRVVRRPLAGGALEILTNDARDGTRVAVVGPPDVVAYITQPAGKQDSLARVRLPDGRRLDLTPEGAAASSVSLARSGEDVIASYIDGRSGMTPMHARRLRLPSGTLDPDVVVWVSGATQGMTEITSVGTADGSFLLLPVEQDASHFGLAALALGLEPKMDPPLHWRTFRNGLDRSPAAGARLCGAAATSYVRPIDESPTSHQELMISELNPSGPTPSEQLATARGFADVSLYPTPDGAVLAYVADRRTWARLIRCK
jgi:hypothetical protein